MIEKQVPGIKFDIDRKEQKANVIHNKIPNRENENWCKRKIDMFLQRVTCNKTHTTFVRKTTWVLVYNCLLLVIKASYHKSTRDLSTAINQVDYITVKKLIGTVKGYCLSVIDSDIAQCPFGLKFKHNNKIFKELYISFLSSFKGHSNKRKENFYEAINARKQHFLKIP